MFDNDVPPDCDHVLAKFLPTLKLIRQSDSTALLPLVSKVLHRLAFSIRNNVCFYTAYLTGKSVDLAAELCRIFISFPPASLGQETTVALLALVLATPSPYQTDSLIPMLNLMLVESMFASFGVELANMLNDFSALGFVMMPPGFCQYLTRLPRDALTPEYELLIQNVAVYTFESIASDTILLRCKQNTINTIVQLTLRRSVSLTTAVALSKLIMSDNGKPFILMIGSEQFLDLLYMFCLLSRNTASQVKLILLDACLCPLTMSIFVEDSASSLKSCSMRFYVLICELAEMKNISSFEELYDSFTTSKISMSIYRAYLDLYAFELNVYFESRKPQKLLTDLLAGFEPESDGFNLSNWVAQLMELDLGQMHFIHSTTAYSESAIAKINHIINLLSGGGYGNVPFLATVLECIACLIYITNFQVQSAELIPNFLQQFEAVAAYEHEHCQLRVWLRSRYLPTVWEFFSFAVQIRTIDLDCALRVVGFFVHRGFGEATNLIETCLIDLQDSDLNYATIMAAVPLPLFLIAVARAWCALMVCGEYRPIFFNFCIQNRLLNASHCQQIMTCFFG